VWLHCVERRVKRRPDVVSQLPASSTSSAHAPATGWTAFHRETDTFVLCEYFKNRLFVSLRATQYDIGRKVKFGTYYTLVHGPWTRPSFWTPESRARERGPYSRAVLAKALSRNVFCQRCREHGCSVHIRVDGPWTRASWTPVSMTRRHGCQKMTPVSTGRGHGRPKWYPCRPYGHGSWTRVVCADLGAGKC